MNVLEDLGEEANASDFIQTVSNQHKVDRDQTEYGSLKEEKCKLHKDLTSMTLKEKILRGKVRESEFQVDGYREKLDRVERTVLELWQALTESNK